MAVQVTSPKFNMSKLWLTKQGNYVDFNGNVVGSKEKGLTTKAIEYLKSKYGNEYTDRVNSNMRNGNIYQNNTWRGNDPSSTKTQDFSTAINNLKNSYKKDSFGYYFKNYQGDNIYFNQKAAEAKKEWEQLHKNTTNQNPLLIHQIPTKNKIHVIDNYSPNFNYIVEIFLKKDSLIGEIFQITILLEIIFLISYIININLKVMMIGKNRFMHY